MKLLGNLPALFGRAAAAACVALALAAGSLPAQELKPALVVAIASVEEQLADVGYITRAIGMEDAGRTAILFGNAFTNGIDKKRPAGLYVVHRGGEFVAVAFVPVTDLQGFLATFKEQIGEPVDAGDGVLEVGKGQTVFVKEQTGWAFVAQSKDHLTGLPADPVKLVGALPKEYNVAARALIDNVPAELRKWAVDEMKVAFERAQENQPASDNPLQELQQKLNRNNLENLARYADEVEEITIGLAIDSVNKKTYFDTAVVGKEGTSLARQAALQAESKSNFLGFMAAGSSLTLNAASKLTPEDAAQSASAIAVIRETTLKKIDDDASLDTAKRDAVKEIVTALFGVADGTLKSGKIDIGSAVVLEAKAIAFVGGLHVSDGAAVEKAVKKLVEVAKNEPDFPKVELDAATHGAVKLHRVTVPLPEGEAEAREFFGENLEVVLGTAPTAVYLAFGKNSEALLKKAIDDSAAQAEKPVLPMQLHVSLLPILKFAQSVDDNPIVPVLVTALEQAGNDRISISQLPQPRGIITRFEIGEGVLQTIGEAVKAFGGSLRGAL